MSRDDLIEALAKARHENWCDDAQEANSWPCEFCIARTEDIVDTDNGWAAIVEFVEAWLLRPGGCVPWLAKEWREDMSQ